MFVRYACGVVIGEVTQVQRHDCNTNRLFVVVYLRPILNLRSGETDRWL